MSYFGLASAMRKNWRSSIGKKHNATLLHNARSNVGGMDVNNFFRTSSFNDAETNPADVLWEAGALFISRWTSLTTADHCPLVSRMFET